LAWGKERTQGHGLLEQDHKT